MWVWVLLFVYGKATKFFCPKVGVCAICECVFYVDYSKSAFQHNLGHAALNIAAPFTFSQKGNQKFAWWAKITSANMLRKSTREVYSAFRGQRDKTEAKLWWQSPGFLVPGLKHSIACEWRWCLSWCSISGNWRKNAAAKLAVTVNIRGKEVREPVCAP